MSETALSLAVANDGHVIKRLRETGGIGLKMANKLYAFMAQERAKRAGEAAEAAARLGGNGHPEGNP